MFRTSLIATAVLSFSLSAAQAAEVQGSASVSAPGASAQGSASISNPFDLKASKEAAAKMATGSRDAAVNAGIGAMVSGQSSAEAMKTATTAASTEAKNAAQATADKTKADLAARMGQTQATVAGYKQTAAQKISLKDRVALGKYFGVGKATNKAIGAVFGASANSSSDLPKGYESQLVIGAKLDAQLAGKAVAVDTSLVKGLSVQPKGTELVKIGNRAVRLDSKTRVVLDVTTI